MKHENENLEKNISRLVKLTGDKDGPSQAFTESVIDGALGELKEHGGSRRRDRRVTIMTGKKMLAYAAGVAIVCGIAAMLFMRHTGQEQYVVTDAVETKKDAVKIEAPAAEAFYGLDTGAAGSREAVVRAVGEQRMKIEYADAPAAAVKPVSLGMVAEEKEVLKAPIPLVLPSPVFLGTPQAIAGITHLEKPLGTARPPFLAPVGTRNVALGKAVSSSDEMPIIGTLDMITDGDKEAGDGSYVELGPMRQHVTIDLGERYNIYAVVVWHYHKQPRVYKDVVVQVADDADFIINVHTIFNNDIDNSLGLGVGQNMHYIETAEGKLIDAKGVAGRYVRLWSAGNSSNDLNQYIEVDVYGMESGKEESKLAPVLVDAGKPVFVGTPQGIPILGDVSGNGIVYGDRTGAADQFWAGSAPAPEIAKMDSVSSTEALGFLGAAKQPSDWTDGYGIGGGYEAEAPAEPGAYGYRPAHGGTTPPNGEDVDAMFFKNYGVNPFVDTEDDHLSTFATDVDTGAYTVCRGYLQDGLLPPNDAVRVEEFVNYFKYGYAAPQEDDFAVYMEGAPWRFGEGRKNSRLLRIGLKARQVSEENRKPAILTFVIDVSGSMNREDRLGLVKRSLRMLVERLKPEDRVGIAVYGSRGRKVMDYRGLDERAEILAAIDSLCAGGSTYAEEGIRIGYRMAERAYRKGYINRVILCSDGVANVGKTGADGILEVIKEKAAKGITLSAIGFGMGNYNDILLERLGDKGNGSYAYIDTIAEAKKIFEDNLTGTLQVIARDVKVQVDFNPEVVRSYRLIGYENRDVPDDKFRDDKYDGGEIGAGHMVTALYELKLWPEKKGTVAMTYVRYKHAETDAVTEFKSSSGTDDLNGSFDGSSKEFRLAATVGEFAEILRESYWAKGASLDDVLRDAQRLSKEFARNADVIEFVDLISKAKQLVKTTQEPAEQGEVVSEE